MLRKFAPLNTLDSKCKFKYFQLPKWRAITNSVFLSIFVNVGIKSHGCIEQEKGIIVLCTALSNCN